MHVCISTCLHNVKHFQPIERVIEHDISVKAHHASEPIRITVVDTPYKDGVLCLLWWIPYAEAGNYA